MTQMMLQIKKAVDGKVDSLSKHPEVRRDQFLDLSTIFLIQGIMPRRRSPTCSMG